MSKLYSFSEQNAKRIAQTVRRVERMPYDQMPRGGHGAPFGGQADSGAWTVYGTSNGTPKTISVRGGTITGFNAYATIADATIEVAGDAGSHHYVYITCSMPSLSGAAWAPDSTPTYPVHTETVFNLVMFEVWIENSAVRWKYHRAIDVKSWYDI